MARDVLTWGFAPDYRAKWRFLSTLLERVVVAASPRPTFRTGQACLYELVQQIPHRTTVLVQQSGAFGGRDAAPTADLVEEHLTLAVL